VLAAVYMLWMYQRVMLGKLDNEENKTLKDVSAREVWVLVPVLVLIVFIGVYPKPFLSRTEASSLALLERVRARTSASAVYDAPRKLSLTETSAMDVGHLSDGETAEDSGSGVPEDDS
jgi:hypothetical protein